MSETLYVLFVGVLILATMFVEGENSYDRADWYYRSLAWRKFLLRWSMRLLAVALIFAAHFYWIPNINLAIGFSLGIAWVGFYIQQIDKDSSYGSQHILVKIASWLMIVAVGFASLGYLFMGLLTALMAEMKSY